jgi:tetratricopeptide (TPR) repeat protein
MKVLILKKKKALFTFSTIALLIFVTIRLQLHTLEADSLYRQYKNTKQLFFLEKATELDPGNAFYKYNLAMEYAKAERLKDAIRLCISAVELNPTNPWYHLGLAWLAYMTKETRISPKKELELALKLDPTNPIVKRYIEKWRKHDLF